MTRPLRSRLAGQEGVNTLETVLTLPVALTGIALIFHTALWLHAGQVVTGAAHQALTVAQAADSTEQAGIDAAHDWLDQAGGVRTPAITVTRTATHVQVDITAEAPNLLPGMVWHVSTTTSGPVERFVPEPER